MKKSSFHQTYNDERKTFDYSIAVFLLFCIMIFGTWSACTPRDKGQTDEKTEKTSLTDVAMGTVVSFGIYRGAGMSQEDAKACAADVLKLVKRLEEDRLSRRLETSELFLVNQNAGNAQGCIISKEFSDMLEACEQIREDSDGAFDISVGALSALWKMDERAGMEEDGMLPSKEEVEEALSHCGGSAFRRSDDRVFLEKGASIELGSVGKGIALDEIAAYLEGKALAGTFALGGSVLTYGEKPDGTPWNIGVTDPFHPERMLGTLTLKGQWCVSTSGDYERFFMQDGVRYHHLLDPATGYPAWNGLRSVTVVCKSGFLSDALSTACFVLGKEKGIALAEKYGVEILMVGEEGELYVSDGLKNKFFVEK